MGPDSDLVAGYREAGDRLDFTPALRHRLALYGLCLGLLVVVECGPRGYEDSDHLAWCRTYPAERVAALRALGAGEPVAGQARPARRRRRDTAGDPAGGIAGLLGRRLEFVNPPDKNL